jgi:hypothetical protein
MFHLINKPQWNIAYCIFMAKRWKPLMRLTIFFFDDTQNSMQCHFIILCDTIVLWLDIFTYFFTYTEDVTRAQILFINTH